MKSSATDTRTYYDEHQYARVLALVIISLSWFVTALNLSASLVAIPSIARDLQADAIHTSWIPSAFLLSNLIALLPGGKLADLYGLKRMFLLGNAILLLGSVLAGCSSALCSSEPLTGRVSVKDGFLATPWAMKFTAS